MIVLNGKQIAQLFIHVRMGAMSWRIRKEEWPELMQILNQFNERAYNRELVTKDLETLKNGHKLRVLCKESDRVD